VVCTGINPDDFIRVFEIVVDHSLAVGHGLFGSTTKRNRRNYGPFRRVDHRRTFGPAVEDKDVFRHGIVDDRIRVLVGLDLTGLLESLEIENDDLARIAISDKPAPEIVEYNDAVAPFQIRNGADDGPVVGIEHFDLGTMREIDTARRGVKRNVVEILD